MALSHFVGNARNHFRRKKIFYNFQWHEHNENLTLISKFPLCMNKMRLRCLVRGWMRQKQAYIQYTYTVLMFKRESVSNLTVFLDHLPIKWVKRKKDLRNLLIFIVNRSEKTDDFFGGQMDMFSLIHQHCTDKLNECNEHFCW